MNEPKAFPSVVFTSKGDTFEPWIDTRRTATMIMVIATGIAFIDDIIRGDITSINYLFDD